MGWLKKIDFLFDRVVDIFAVLAGVLAACVVTSICFQIVLRYFFHRPLEWVVETNEYALVFITFLGTAWVLKNEGHVRVDFLLNQLQPSRRTFLNIVTSIICAILCVVLTWYTAKLTLDYLLREVLSEKALHIPKAPILAVIPIGNFLLFIQCLRRTYKYFKG